MQREMYFTSHRLSFCYPEIQGQCCVLDHSCVYVVGDRCCFLGQYCTHYWRPRSLLHSVFKQWPSVILALMRSEFIVAKNVTGRQTHKEFFTHARA
jgi:hypothetical protein